MKKILFVLIFTVALVSAKAQKYRLYFKDKGERIEMLSDPLSFLSQRALERRADDGIWVDETDLPVSAAYTHEVEALGSTVLASSRWFNYVLVDKLPTETPEFVEYIEPVKKYKINYAEIKEAGLSLGYGQATGQIQMLRGDILHNLNYQGQGMLIAVIDAGFSGVDNISALDSLRLQSRIIATYDFTDNDTFVYQSGDHGTRVLSVMAANVPDNIVGVAPQASYLLLTSEVGLSETPVELDNWLRAAEFADSAGADVINSSLGYNVFDDPQDNFTYADMDGNTTLVTKAADMAAKKGIAVTVSAGNEGGGSWQYITAPADADSVLAIGAVDAQKNYSGFSSRGPSADGRVKPDVAAQGSGVTLVGSFGITSSGSGTSFASPIIAGLTACLMQARPMYNNIEVQQNIRQSASQNFAPDDYMGYGIPNFELALYLLIGQEELSANSLDVKVYPNPVKDVLNIELGNEISNTKLNAEIYNMSGQLIYISQLLKDARNEIPMNMANGVYVLKVRGKEVLLQQKIIK